MVMGPTPPGTGVMNEAFARASSKATSPTSRVPLVLLGSSMLLIQTSYTTAPSLTMSAVTNCGIPMAAIRMSASEVISAKFSVLE